MLKIVRLVIVTAVLAVGLSITGCSVGMDKKQVPVPGRPAPDFQLQSLDGQAFSLSGLKGRPVMINFWATWCPPCREEMPFIQQVYQDPQWTEQGLVILAVNRAESPAVVREFMDDMGLTFTVLLDADQAVTRMYNVAAIPTTFFVDKNGIIKDIKLGAFTSKAQIDQKLLRLITEE